MQPDGLARKHLPTAIAIAANAFVVGLLSLSPYAVHSELNDSISVSMGDFLTKDETSAPPLHVNTAANQVVLRQAVQQMMTATSTTQTATDLSAITTMAPNPVSLEVKAPAPIAPSSETLAAMNKANQEFTKAATAAATPGTIGQGGIGQSLTTTGQGIGVGNGTVNGVKVSRHPGSAKAAGNYGAGWDNAPGKDTFKNQRIVVLLDKSESMELNNRPEVIRQLLGQNQVIGQITFYWTTFASQPRSTSAVKKMAEENQFANWQDAYEAWGGVPKTTQNGTTDTGNIRSAILRACEQYAGQNALLVVVSDFNELDSRMEDVPELVDKLTKAGLRLYMVHLTGGMYMKNYTSPDEPAAFVTAVMSGGGARNVDIRQIGSGLPIEFENPYR